MGSNQRLENTGQ